MDRPKHDGELDRNRPGVWTFCRLAPRQNAPLDQLLLAVAAEFGSCDRAAALDCLDELARPLFGLPSMQPERVARELVRVLVVEGGFERVQTGVEPLLLDRVLERRSGRPVLLAAVFAEVARRAGVELALVSDDEDWYVGIEDEDGLVLVATGAIGPHQRWNLRRRCQHELAHAVLQELGRTLEQAGDRAGADHAVWLQAMLPLAY